MLDFEIRSFFGRIWINYLPRCNFFAWLICENHSWNFSRSTQTKRDVFFVIQKRDFIRSRWMLFSFPKYQWCSLKVWDILQKRWHIQGSKFMPELELELWSWAHIRSLGAFSTESLCELKKAWTLNWTFFSDHPNELILIWTLGTMYNSALFIPLLVRTSLGDCEEICK